MKVGKKNNPDLLLRNKTPILYLIMAKILFMDVRQCLEFYAEATLAKPYSIHLRPASI